MLVEQRKKNLQLEMVLPLIGISILIMFFFFSYELIGHDGFALLNIVRDENFIVQEGTVRVYVMENKYYFNENGYDDIWSLMNAMDIKKNMIKNTIVELRVEEEVQYKTILKTLQQFHIEGFDKIIFKDTNNI